MTYKEMVVGGLLDELLAVDDGLVEGGAESDSGHIVGRILYTVSSATSYRRLCLCLSYLNLNSGKVWSLLGYGGIESC